MHIENRGLTVRCLHEDSNIIAKPQSLSMLDRTNLKRQQTSLIQRQNGGIFNNKLIAGSEKHLNIHKLGKSSGGGEKGTSEYTGILRDIGYAQFA